MAASAFPARVVRESLFVVAAVLAFPVVAAFIALAAPKLTLLQHRSPAGLVANHLVTLGWGTMVALGALHQMLPAAAGVRRDISPLMPLQFGAHVAGIVLLASGLLVGSHPMTVAGGTSITVAVLLFLGVAAPVVRQRRRALPVLRYVVVALACLGATILWGLLLAVNRALVFSTALLGPSGLAVHVALGLIGWFAVLITGVSYYLLPRFAGVKEPAGGRPGAVLAGLVASIVLIGAGAFLHPAMARLGTMCAGIAGMIYAADLVRFLRLWRPTARDIARAHWYVLTGQTAVLAAGATVSALGWLPGDGLRWGVAGVVLFLLGWVTLAITGQFYKVTPFLMWYYRFSLGLSAYEIPRLDAPYWPRIAVAPFALLASAAPVVSLGVLLASPTLGLAGGLAYLAGAAIFSFALGYSWLPAFLRGRRPPSPAEPR